MTAFMSDGTNISREELLELATADALGVIDEVDSARFERAFAASVPSLQAEVRALQDRIAVDPNLLSTEQAPASLRLKTLAHVAAAREEHAAPPIATIGPARPVGSRASGTRQQIDRDALVREILERTALERRPTQHVWRAAALFLFAALVVALYFESQQRATSARLMDFVDRKLVDEAMQAVASATAGFDFAQSRELAVLDAAGNRAKLVRAYLDESSGRVCVVGFGFNATGRHVSVSHASGTKGPSQIALASSVVEERGFAVVFDRPADGGPLRLEVGTDVLTITA